MNKLQLVALRHAWLGHSITNTSKVFIILKNKHDKSFKTLFLCKNSWESIIFIKVYDMIQLSGQQLMLQVQKLYYVLKANIS